jgi:hypothetical protein
VAAQAGAQPAWAHQAPGFQSNGVITVKSLAGGTYGGTENPTGAVARVNQSAVTQPPTVIIQATGSVYAFAATKATTTGNMGGVAGGTAMCIAEFGAGWKMATVGRAYAASLPMLNQSTVNVLTAWVDSASSGQSCNGWTSSSAGINGIVMGGNTFNVSNNAGGNCSTAFPVMCTNF